MSVLLHYSNGCDLAFIANTNATLRERPDIGSYKLPDMARLTSLLCYLKLPVNNSSELPVKLNELPD